MRPLLVCRTMGPVDFVFDILDTEGAPVPEDAFSFPTFGDLSKKQFTNFWDSVARERIVIVELDANDGRADWIRLVEKAKAKHIYQLAYNGNHPPSTCFVTVVHELTHLSLGHLGDDPSRRVPSKLNAPQSFVIREECVKASWQHGYRRVLGETNGWAAFESTTAQGTLWLSAASEQGPWFLALDHPGVIAEHALPSTNITGPGINRYTFTTLTSLYDVLPRIYQISTSLPDAPLKTFHQQTAKVPQTTEVERVVVQRIGQDIFRKSLMEYWQSRCPLTGITDPELLRASHIVPWSVCQDDTQRLDVHNGLLLSALWDAAFDRALVTFYDDGKPDFSSKLSDAARQALQWGVPLQLNDAHRKYLMKHRLRFFELQKMESDSK